jgi:hypothetical protein
MAHYHRQRAVKIERPHPGEAGAGWIEQHRSELPNNQWIAASGRGLVTYKPTIGALMEELSHMHIDPEAVAITFVTSDAV